MVAELTLILGLSTDAAVAAKEAKPKASFGEALGRAGANMKTPEGKHYDATLAAYATEHHGAFMGACVEATEAPDLATFQVVLKVAADGRISEVAKPETNLAACFREKLRQSSLPTPPRPGYWVVIEMNLSQ